MDIHTVGEEAITGNGDKITGIGKYGCCQKTESRIGIQILVGKA